ncbi:hypothetical protein QJQ45_010333 [Haematococcus lacustris]|nr:hypothetical protein QJQ45_010333 [Haematococcus lacustris]
MFINSTSCIRAAAVHLILLAVSVSSFCLDNDAVLALANEFRLGLTHSTGYELGETLYQESYTPARTEPQSCLAAVMSWYNEVYNYSHSTTTSQYVCYEGSRRHAIMYNASLGNVGDDAQWLHNVLPIMEVSEESSSESSPSLLDAWVMPQNSVTATGSSSRTLPANASHGGAPPNDSRAPAEESSEESSLNSSGDETAESAADASHEQMAADPLQQASARQSSPSRRAGRRHLKERRLRTVTRE